MRYALLTLFAFSTAAVPPADAPPDELVRAANDLVRQKNLPLAEKLFAQAEERSNDPGLIAFNRAGLLFELEEYREAEVNYVRCLDDKAIPAERRRQALYNRGVCLVRRGDDEKVLRAAISCFEECLDASPADGPLAADARHNLELAKLLWNQARARSATPPTPNDHFPDELPPTKPPEVTGEDVGTDPGGSPQVGGTPMTVPATSQAQQQPNAGANATPPKSPGAGTAPVLTGDADAVKKLSPEDTNLLLDQADARLRTARRRNEQMRAGPERPNVRDW